MSEKVKMNKPNYPTVSVIIPCYNGARFLSEAIKSVQDQTYQQFEIIVVDDGSSDNSREVATCYSDVKYIYQDNQGSCVARNRGASESKGDYLVFLDCDDRLLLNALEVGVKNLNNYPDCGFVAGGSREIDAEGLPLLTQHITQTSNYQLMLAGQAFVPPAVLMFKRAAFEAVGGFDSSFGRYGAEDLDIYLNIAQKFPVHCHKQIVVEYRRHGNSVSDNAPKILEATFQALDKQRQFVKGNQEYETAYATGRRHWINIYGPWIPNVMARRLKERKFSLAIHALLIGLRYYPQGFLNYIFGKLAHKNK